jgi:hypothetical protein
LSWSKRFDEPIVLADRTTLRTLRDAIQHLADIVPKAEQMDEKVTIAADHLTRSAEQNYPMYFARAATLQAIYRNREHVFNRDRNDHHCGKRKLRETSKALVPRQPINGSQLCLDSRNAPVNLWLGLSISARNYGFPSVNAGDDRDRRDLETIIDNRKPLSNNPH